MRQKLFDMINWWLEKGIAGFRIDAIINIKKDLSWTSLPADGEDGLVAVQASLENAQPIEPFLRELKETCFDPHNAFTVGEVFNETEEELHFFIGEDGMFSSIFDFKQAILGQKGNGWHDFVEPSAEEIKRSIFDAHKRADEIGVLSTIIENHDESRGVSHFIPKADLSDQSKKALATIQLLRKGIPFIYQGQEIGMENQVFTRLEDFDDISTLNEYHVALEYGVSAEAALQAAGKYSRDNARTPMQWTDEECLGFSTIKPWLISPYPNTAINVADQEKEAKSVLGYYRALTALYRHPVYGETIRSGAFRPLYEEVKNVIAYERSGEEIIQVVVNFQPEATLLTLSAVPKEIILQNSHEVDLQENVVHLQPYQAVVVAL
ncbi:glycosidase [Streptococcus gallinaceus]|nr:glycosidase [Streptococcus gallinaceus]MCP1770370.1 glycosidase [Streptococcus gallinaceus]